MWPVFSHNLIVQEAFESAAQKNEETISVNFRAIDFFCASLPRNQIHTTCMDGHSKIMSNHRADGYGCSLS